jgi:hypothetical protein
MVPVLRRIILPLVLGAATAACGGGGGSHPAPMPPPMNPPPPGAQRGPLTEKDVGPLAP